MLLITWIMIQGTTLREGKKKVLICFKEESNCISLSSCPFSSACNTLLSCLKQLSSAFPSSHPSPVCLLPLNLPPIHCFLSQFTSPCCFFPFMYTSPNLEFHTCIEFDCLLVLAGHHIGAQFPSLLALTQKHRPQQTDGMPIPPSSHFNHRALLGVKEALPLGHGTDLGGQARCHVLEASQRAGQ